MLVLTVFPDGTEYIGFGIAPDIEVKASIKDVIENRDAALDIAIRELSDGGECDE